MRNTIQHPFNLHNYRSIRKLGTGISGSTFLVESTVEGTQQNNEVFAMKIIDLTYLNKEEIAKVLRERRILGELSDNRIPFLHNWIWETCLFIVIEFIDGETLSERMEREKIGGGMIYEIVKEVGKILEYLHEHGVVHRDLKPDNIMITKEGKIKVIDFGIAALLKRKTEEANTEKKEYTQGIIGPLQYSSPEIFDEHGFEPDIWSFGVLIYQLLTRKLPFPGIYYVFKKEYDHEPLKSKCSPKVMDLIKSIFVNMDQRPKIKDILSIFESLKASDFEGNEELIPKSNLSVAATQHILPYRRKIIIDQGAYMNRLGFSGPNEQSIQFTSYEVDLPNFSLSDPKLASKQDIIMRFKVYLNKLGVDLSNIPEINIIERFNSNSGVKESIMEILKAELNSVVSFIPSSKLGSYTQKIPCTIIDSGYTSTDISSYKKGELDRNGSQFTIFPVGGFDITRRLCDIERIRIELLTASQIEKLRERYSESGDCKLTEYFLGVKRNVGKGYFTLAQSVYAHIISKHQNIPHYFNNIVLVGGNSKLTLFAHSLKQQLYQLLVRDNIKGVVVNVSHLECSIWDLAAQFYERQQPKIIII